MPNHFHLLIKQNTDRGIAEFMQSLIQRYVMYFNKKYMRVGGLFQSRYKTVLIEDENQFVYITKYIHRNPIDILTAGPASRGVHGISTKLMSQPAGLEAYKYSSYGNYLGLFRQRWVRPEEVLSYFSNRRGTNTYQDFVEDTMAHDLTKVYYEMIDMDN